mgnify:CR=1 FL=1
MESKCYNVKRIADALERMAAVLEGISETLIRFLKKYEERMQKVETEKQKLLEYYLKHFKTLSPKEKTE